MNNSYIPIGGALLLAFTKNGSRSLPVTPESKLFETSLSSKSHLNNNDFLHAIGWDNGNQYITMEIDDTTRIPMSVSKQVGVKDLNRLKTLIELSRKKIRLHQAARIILNKQDISSFIDLIPASEDSLSLFLDMESQFNGGKTLSHSEKNSIINMIQYISNQDVGLFRMAAQVDSLPADIGSGKHLAFLPSEITPICRIK